MPELLGYEYHTPHDLIFLLLTNPDVEVLDDLVEYEKIMRVLPVIYDMINIYDKLDMLIQLERIPYRKLFYRDIFAEYGEDSIWDLWENQKIGV